jgi:putative multicomponent Na+:H+ antiporter subunit B
MNDNSYIYVLVALLPLSACMLVFQVNPYHALLLRGVLGAIAALVYTILGAGDVGLTEALMGTLLAITLYAVTVRSSLVLRLGVIEDGIQDAVSDEKTTGHFKQLIDDIRAVFKKRHMRLEVVPYATSKALQRALIEKEVHATCSPQEQQEQSDKVQPYNTTIRVRRVYEIMETELASPGTTLTYVNTPKIEEKHWSVTQG